MSPTATRASDYQAQFEAFESGLSLNGSGWLHQHRKAALARFQELGFPTARRGNEAWKYTNVAPIARGAFTSAANGQEPSVTPADVRRLAPDARGWTRLVFVDGRFAGSLSSPPRNDGVRVANLAEAAATDRDLVERHLTRYAGYEDEAFTALNTAFLRDGAFIGLERGQTIDDAVHLVFVATGREATAANPRVLIVAREESRATIVESYVSLGDAARFTNAVTEIALEPGATVDHYRLALESPATYHVGLTRASLGRDATLNSASITLGAALVRHDLGVSLDGPGASCRLNGLYAARDSQHVDNHTFIDHASPHTTSRQYYKGVVDGESRAVFSGRVLVRPSAQHADAQQSNRNLVLSQGAEVDTKPSLEIFADDVRCSHGATAGHLDEDAVFYLRSRGLDEDMARGVLVRGFVQEIIDTIGLNAVRAFTTRLFAASLAGA